MPLPADLLCKYGPWAVITGSSSGIGSQFAHQLAASGFSLVLVARRSARLDDHAKCLRTLAPHPIKIRTLAADLATDDGIRAVVEYTADLDVGLLVNNAGTVLHGSFFRHEPEAYRHMIALNVTAVTTLAHAIGKRLGQRKRGGIVFTSSIAQSGFPNFATYSATKSYISTLALLLRGELAPRGVDVLCLEPGAVESEIVDVLREEGVNFDAIGMKPMPVEDCVEEALRSLHRGDAKVTPGLMNKNMMAVAELIPEQMRLGMLDTAMGKTMAENSRSFPEE